MNCCPTVSVVLETSCIGTDAGTHVVSDTISLPVLILAFNLLGWLLTAVPMMTTWGNGYFDFRWNIDRMLILCVTGLCMRYVTHVVGLHKAVRGRFHLHIQVLNFMSIWIYLCQAQIFAYVMLITLLYKYYETRLLIQCDPNSLPEPWGVFWL